MALLLLENTDEIAALILTFLLPVAELRVVVLGPRSVKVLFLVSPDFRLYLPVLSSVLGMVVKEC